ncbi:Endoplasmic reticulum protein Pkr1 [Penicillium cf. griseofulvum]|nr:Endoplasmic reticulum protein Pkr1 [Penicillium cf. griseofulvum]
MASFMEDLWSSIFTPGPTPTLLIATNVTFAALQFIFLALLLATYSLHFVALSIISGGLWWSINWFATEVRLAQQAQEAEKEKQEGDDAKTRRKSPRLKLSSPRKTDKPSAVATGSAASGLLPTARDHKKRPSTGAEGSGYGSTDSEWEKVDDTRS